MLTLRGILVIREPWSLLASMQRLEDVETSIAWFLISFHAVFKVLMRSLALIKVWSLTMSWFGSS